MQQLALVFPDTVVEQIKALDTQIAELTAQREALQKQRRVTCVFCKAQHAIGDLVYNQTHTGGDYWKEGEGQFDCPSCQRTNRMLDFHGHEELPKLKWYFREVIKTYPR